MRRMVDRLMEQPWVYRLWQAPFANAKFLRVQKQLDLRPARRVLDVGCGPGTNAERFRHAEYVGVDINERYLAMARSRYRGMFVQADVATDDLTRLGTFDTIIVNSFLHHLPDEILDEIMPRLAGSLTPGGVVHILELVLPDRMGLPRLMARLDRGRHARSIDAWQSLLGRHFEPVSVQPYVLARLWSMLYFQGTTRACASP
jgi:SAM-dependent methyltransferase